MKEMKRQLIKTFLIGIVLIIGTGLETLMINGVNERDDATSLICITGAFALILLMIFALYQIITYKPKTNEQHN